MNDQTTVLKITHYIQESASGKVYTISIPMKVGRVGCNIIVDDTNVSSQHCLLIPDGISLKVKDLGSTNGTFVNKKKLSPNEEANLNEGDQIQIGKVVFAYSEQPIVAASASATVSLKQESIFSFSYLRWFAYAVIAISFLSLQNPPDVSIPENLAFLRSYLSTSKMLINTLMISTALIGINIFAHAYVCHKWLNKVRFPRARSLFRAASVGFVLVGNVYCFMQLEQAYPTANNNQLMHVVKMRPVLLSQVEAKKLNAEDVSRYLYGIKYLLRLNPDNPSNARLKLLMFNDRQLFGLSVK